MRGDTYFEGERKKKLSCTKHTLRAQFSDQDYFTLGFEGFGFFGCRNMYSKVYSLFSFCQNIF